MMTSPDVTAETIDLATATPDAIDTVWERLDANAFFAGLKVMQAAEGLHHAIDDKRDYINRRGYVWRSTTAEALEKAKALAASTEAKPWDVRDAEKAVEKYEEAVAARQAADALMDPFRAEWDRRGGWTRAFIVAGGHVHSSRNCSTCNREGKPTAFGWLPMLSGHDEAEIVEKAGARACTTCYPTAPVDSLGRPSVLFHADEVAAEKARAEREQAKADRLAKKIAKALTPDGSEFRVEFPSGGWVTVGTDENGNRKQVWKATARISSERFATEAAAVQWLVRETVWGRNREDDLALKADAFASIKSAIAEKHGMTADEVDAMIAKKVADKIKRDGLT